VKKVYVVQWDFCLAAFNKLKEAQIFCNSVLTKKKSSSFFILEVNENAKEVLEKYGDKNK